MRTGEPDPARLDFNNAAFQSLLPTAKPQAPELVN